MDVICPNCGYVVMSEMNSCNACDDDLSLYEALMNFEPSPECLIWPHLLFNIVMWGLIGLFIITEFFK